MSLRVCVYASTTSNGDSQNRFAWSSKTSSTLSARKAAILTSADKENALFSQGGGTTIRVIEVRVAV
jgi:hypothetical protein